MEMLQADAKAQKEALASDQRTMIGVNKYKPEQTKKAIRENDRFLNFSLGMKTPKTKNSRNSKEQSFRVQRRLRPSLLTFQMLKESQNM